MKPAEIEQRLGEVALLIAEATPNDLETLGKIRCALDSLGSDKEGPESFRLTTAEALQVLDRVILREVGFDEGMPLVGESLNAMRAALTAPEPLTPATAPRPAETSGRPTPPGEDCGGAAGGKYLTFSLGAEEYGIDILTVREIIGLLSITPVPRAAAYLKGVVNLRGRVVPVIDLRLRFGMPPVEQTPETCIIVVEQEEQQIGLIVDHVSEVVAIPAEEIVPAPAFGSRIESSLISGIGKVGDEIRILLNIHQILVADGLSGSPAAAA